MGRLNETSSELNTALRNVVNLCQTNWLTSLPEVAADSNAGHSDTINMSQYKAVSGRDYSLLDIHKVYPSAVPASDDYYDGHQAIRNAAYQALKLARARSTKTAAKRRNELEPGEVGGMVMIFGEELATESGRSR